MSQIVRKFIQDNAINGQKIRLDNNENLRARNAANSADVNILKLNASNALEIMSLPEAASALPLPSSPKQFATIEYITNFVNGKIDAKDAVNLLSDTTIAGTFTAGSSTVAATIIATTGNLSIDGVVPTVGMRLALTDQTTGSNRGIYDVTVYPNNNTGYTLTRSSDFDGLNGSAEVTSGAYFRVISGTVYSGYEVVLSTADPITLNTTALTFVKYPTTAVIVGGDMITNTSSTLSVDLQASGGLESSNPGNVAGQLRLKLDTASGEKDKTQAIDGSGNLVSRKSNKQLFTLAAGDITNQYVDLTFIAGQSSTQLGVVGGGLQFETDDFTVNYTGGTGGKTRLTFVNGLATAGVSALVAGDKIEAQYTYLTL